MFNVHGADIFCMFETDEILFAQINEMVIRIAEERRIDTWEVQIYLG
jgi:hypothetical protein